MNPRTFVSTLAAGLLLAAAASLALPVPQPSGPVELLGDHRPDIPGLSRIRCFDAEFAWIFCDDPAQAASIAADVREAASLFHRYFGEHPGHGAVVVTTSIGSGAMNDLKARGAQWVMPWVPDEVFANLDIEDQIRQQVETQLRDRGFDDGMVELAVEQALAQLGPRRRGIAGLIAQARPLTHELGHFWFGRLVWGDAWMAPEAARPAAVDGIAHRYGSPSPDWLDEVGAILMETGELTQSRFDQLTTMLAGERRSIRPLSELFTMTHPAMGNQAVMRALRGAQAVAPVEEPQRLEPAAPPRRMAGGVRVMPVTVLPGDADAAGLRDAAAFYAQCRSVAEFMIERSANPRLFARIARDLKDNPSMDDWLRDHGAAHSLPATVDDLDREWLKWAIARHLGDL